jgi:hypothetical protein
MQFCAGNHQSTQDDVSTVSGIKVRWLLTNFPLGASRKEKSWSPGTDVNHTLASATQASGGCSERLHERGQPEAGRRFSKT